MLEKYMEALESGVVNGYGYISSLSDEQIDILCGIASAVTKTPISSREELKSFTTDAGKKTFDRYIKNVELAYADLSKLVR